MTIYIVVEGASTEYISIYIGPALAATCMVGARRRNELQRPSVHNFVIIYRDSTYIHTIEFYSFAILLLHIACTFRCQGIMFSRSVFSSVGFPSSHHMECTAHRTRPRHSGQFLGQNTFCNPFALQPFGYPLLSMHDFSLLKQEPLSIKRSGLLLLSSL